MVRSKVTSRKFTTCKFASAVIFSANLLLLLFLGQIVRKLIIMELFSGLSAKRAELFLIESPSAHVIDSLNQVHLPKLSISFSMKTSV